MNARFCAQAFDRVGPSGAAAWMAVMGAIADNN